jgi:endoglucanase
MKRRQFLSAGALAMWGSLRVLSRQLAAASPNNLVRRGVSVAGPEFAAERADFCNETPGVFGRDYTYNSERTIAYFCEQSLRLFRLPIRWERIQPRLGQPLDEPELDRVTQVVGWIKKHRGELIIDIHNYGRYALRRGGRKHECVIDQSAGGASGVTRQHFANLWRRLSEAFRDESAVYGYGLMNEPHDMGRSSWKEISQTGVDAIRAGGDNKLVLIAGDGWSNAGHFAELNGRRGWIKDPADHVAYEAHCYFDHDQSGHYELDYTAELARDPGLENRGAERLKPFVRWCRTNNVQGFLGEYGIPCGDARWQNVLRRFLSTLDDAGMESCYWAAGEWWGSYPLSIQPSDDFRQPAPQLSVLRRGNE